MFNIILDCTLLLQMCGDVHCNPGPTSTQNGRMNSGSSAHQPPTSSSRAVYTSKFLHGLRSHRYSHQLDNRTIETIKHFGIYRRNLPRGCRAGQAVQQRAAHSRALAMDRHLDSVADVGQDAGGNSIPVVVGSGQMRRRYSYADEDSRRQFLSNYQQSGSPACITVNYRLPPPPVTDSSQDCLSAAAAQSTTAPTRPASSTTNTDSTPPVAISRQGRAPWNRPSPRCLIEIKRIVLRNSQPSTVVRAETRCLTGIRFLVINPCSLKKNNALQQLEAELNSHDITVAYISET